MPTKVSSRETVVSVKKVPATAKAVSSPAGVEAVAKAVATPSIATPAQEVKATAKSSAPATNTFVVVAKPATTVASGAKKTQKKKSTLASATLARCHAAKLTASEVIAQNRAKVIPSFRKMRKFLGTYDKCPLDYESCNIGRRQIGRFSSLMASTVKFMAANEAEKTISVPRGREILKSFLSRNDMKTFLPNGTNTTFDDHNVNSAITIQKNVLAMLKSLRGNSTKDACMLRNALYAAMLPGMDVETATKSGDDRYSGKKKDLPPEHYKEIKQVVNAVARTFGMFQSVHFI